MRPNKRGLRSSLRAQAKQSTATKEGWIASSRSLSSGAHSRDPLAPRNDGKYDHSSDSESTGSIMKRRQWIGFWALRQYLSQILAPRSFW